VGLWIVQECRRHWAREDREYSYGELTRLAMEAPPLRSLIQANDPRFIRPIDMPAEVQEFCRNTSQPVPETPGQIIRCVLESLALLYRRSLDELERLTGRELHTLHIVGGGSRNELLNQFTANATGRRVIAGPVEATAVGNLLVQAIAMKHLDSLAAMRAVVRDSFDVVTFEPVEREVWEAAYEKFGVGAA